MRTDFLLRLSLLTPLALLVLGCTSQPACPPARGPEKQTVDEGVVRGADLTFAVDARPFANLAFHLDCLSDRIACEKQAFQQLWDPGWSADDAAALAEWKSVQEAYDVSVQLAIDVGVLPMPLSYNNLDFGKRLRVAALRANTVDDFVESARQLLPAPDVAHLRHAALHFLPRFAEFWAKTGAPIASRFRVRLVDLFAHGELPALIARAARFYGVTFDRDAVMDFDLVVAPGASKHSNAEQVLSHGIIEVTGDEKAEDRMDVVCHELFHFFYASRNPEKQAALMNQFLATNDAHAELAYALLDESVATALGNGVVDRIVSPADYARRISKEKGFYSVHSIDATAKSLLQRTAADPTLGPPLDSPATIATLIASTHDAIGDDPPALEYLRDVAGIAEPGWWTPAMKAVIERAHGNHLYTYDALESAEAVGEVTHHSALPVIVMVPRARLLALEAYGEVIPKSTRLAIADAAKTPGAFAYSQRRGLSSWLFVLVADTPEQAKIAAETVFFAPHVTAGVLRATP